MNKETTCCFTGPRPERLPAFGDPKSEEIRALERSLQKAIRNAYDDGYRFFMSGMADGFDLMAAEAVLALKKELDGICLVAVFPYADAASRHPKAVRDRICRILSRCDLSLSLQPAYSTGCEFRRNVYMVDASFRVIGYYTGLSHGTAHCWHYAGQNHLELINLYGGEVNEKI